ncbi:MAG: WecB/TagA/CpsF family glycosyltransferase [Candidatus Moranbacteria bacterium]|nr:WecB/TagA/CpsF family glycosyltransferase [Candidatus Moranbacteria bacterium]
MVQNSFIFNTRVDNLKKQDIFRIIDDSLQSDSFHQIATINPEFLLLARKNSAFRDILNGCDLNVSDGVGVHVAFWRQGERLWARMAGADLMAYILQQAQEKHLSVMCIIRKDGLSIWKDIRRALKKFYPTLHVEGMDIGHAMSIDMLRAETQQRISGSNILLCNFGVPYQEVFLAGLRKNQSAIRVAMGVGGSFDFLTGKLKRAPKWMRDTGLEWLWRLLLQPKRFKRIWKAVVIFPLRVILRIK